MARTGIPRTKSAVELDEDHQQPQDKNFKGTSLNGEKKSSSSSSKWVPHPHSATYFPQGQEWVMDDVPKGAAPFGQTYWFGNDVEGVEKPDP
ncbi:hypothetical protein Patl1_35326 [Pistacia atlantica]|nr:hypothetical protein Patl1_35326 [Pistacia atlantica]